MAGTKIGGQKAARTNTSKYGRDFYARIGAIGGRNGRTGGFYHSKANGLTIHIEAGRKGGKISRRGPNPLSKRQQRLRKQVEDLNLIVEPS